MTHNTSHNHAHKEKPQPLIMALLVAAVVIAGIFLWRQRTKSSSVILDSVETTRASEVVPATIGATGSLDARTIVREGYQFNAPAGWIDNPITVDECPWDTIVFESNGLVSRGEIGIYPASCFDISLHEGTYRERADIDDYYIVAYYEEPAPGANIENIQLTKDAFAEVKRSFQTRY